MHAADFAVSNPPPESTESRSQLDERCDEQIQTPLCGHIDQWLGLGASQRQRLFNEDVFAVLER